MKTSTVIALFIAPLSPLALAAPTAKIGRDTAALIKRLGVEADLTQIAAAAEAAASALYEAPGSQSLQ